LRLRGRRYFSRKGAKHAKLNFKIKKAVFFQTAYSALQFGGRNPGTSRVPQIKTAAKDFSSRAIRAIQKSVRETKGSTKKLKYK
jgi:hypothetical protein